jgi:hypothetical protein
MKVRSEGLAVSSPVRKGGEVRSRSARRPEVAGTKP